MSAKKTTKSATKKPAASKAVPSHPTWADMIKECIAVNTEDARIGVSRPQIKKYVESKYKLEIGAAQSTQLAKAITTGAEKGVFVLPKGPSGRVKLAPKSKPDASSKENKPTSKSVKPVSKSLKPASKSAKPASKSAATTKAKTTKSPVTKSTTKPPAKKAAVTAKSKAPAAAKKVLAGKAKTKAAPAKKTTAASKRAPAKKAVTGSTAASKASASRKVATKKSAKKVAPKKAALVTAKPKVARKSPTKRS